MKVSEGFQPSQVVSGTYKSSGERIVVILTEKGKPISTTLSTVFQTSSQGFRLSATLTILKKTGSVTGDSMNYSWSSSNNKTEYLSNIDNSFSQPESLAGVVERRFVVGKSRFKRGLGEPHISLVWLAVLRCHCCLVNPG